MLGTRMGCAREPASDEAAPPALSLREAYTIIKTSENTAWRRGAAVQASDFWFPGLSLARKDARITCTRAWRAIQRVPLARSWARYDEARRIRYSTHISRSCAMCPSGVCRPWNGRAPGQAHSRTRTTRPPLFSTGVPRTAGGHDKTVGSLIQSAYPALLTVPQVSTSSSIDLL